MGDGGRRFSSSQDAAAAVTGEVPAGRFLRDARWMGKGRRLTVRLGVATWGKASSRVRYLFSLSRSRRFTERVNGEGGRYEYCTL